MATSANKSTNIDLVAFGDTTQLTDWLNEVAWIFPLLMLSMEPVEVLHIHAKRLGKLREVALENFDNSASALIAKSSGMLKEVDSMRRGMAAFTEAATIVDPQSRTSKEEESDRVLRDALWEVLESEALALEPIRKLLEKESSGFLNGLETLPNQRIEQAQTALEEGLLEQAMERSRLIRESRKHLKEAMSLDGVELAPIYWAELGWMNWQASAGEKESIEWFASVMSGKDAEKGIGIGLSARLYAYFLSKVGLFNEAYRWSKVAADQMPCVGTYHERAQYAMSAATLDVAKREVTAFIKKSPLATLLAFADPKISELGPDLVDICVKRQQQIRQKAQIAVGEWELASKSIEEILKELPMIQVGIDLIEGSSKAKAGLDLAHFLVASQRLEKATESKASLTRAITTGIQREKRKRTETLAQARRIVEAVMQERDDLLKSSTETHDEEISTARAALVESDDNAKAQRGCSMGMGGGCAMMVLYGVAMLLAGKGTAMGPATPIGMLCIALSLVPVGASIVYYIGCMSRRMVLENKLGARVEAAKKVYDLARNDANSKFRTRLESAKAQVSQEEKLLQKAEAVAKQFGC